MQRLLHVINGPARALSRIEEYFFRRESASGVGLMRMAWGAAVFLSMGIRSGDVIRYYTNQGLWPEDIYATMVRQQHFSVLDTIHSVQSVALVYTALLTFALFTMIGLLPRVSTALTWVLLMSFHERNYMPLAGGDTVIRLTGFLVMISPGLTAWSIHRLRRQWEHWKAKRSLLPPVRMPAWPRILVTWQLVVLYVTCDWFKFYGSNWHSGSAAAFTFHHPHFARFDPAFFDAIPYFYPFVTYLTLVWEMLWIAFLLSPLLGRRIRFIGSGRFRRWMLLIGFAFHAMILVVLEVGNFSYAMFALYLGALKEEDFIAMKKFFRRLVPGPVTMLYDGGCRFCLRITFVNVLLDVLGRVRFVNMRNAAMRKMTAPGVPLKELDRVLHARLPNGRLLTSFAAFRSIVTRIPLYWPLLPILWFPGAKLIGTPVYDYFASRRKRCADENCAL